MNREELNANCAALAEKFHQNCLFKNILRKGRGLHFDFDEKGCLAGTFFCHKRYQGYDNRVHGGIMSTIIDESMVHCLMGHGMVGVTANLLIKYRRPVLVGKKVQLATQFVKTHLSGKLAELTAEIFQDKKLVITAEAKFYIVHSV